MHKKPSFLEMGLRIFRTEVLGDATINARMRAVLLDSVLRERGGEQVCYSFTHSDDFCIFLLCLLRAVLVHSVLRERGGKLVSAESCMLVFVLVLLIDTLRWYFINYGNNPFASEPEY
jgi:hypothetical protein